VKDCDRTEAQFGNRLSNEMIHETRIAHYKMFEYACHEGNDALRDRRVFVV